MTPCPSYFTLEARETLCIDYRIRVRRGCSGIAVMAIHGGGIEPGTTEIADALAGDLHTFYTFSGLKPAGNAALHISSRKLDEPVGLAVARLAETVVTIHGCRDRKAITYVGGRHAALGQAIRNRLLAAGFEAATTQRFPGVNPKNICNRTRTAQGVQLEISMGMRKQLFEDVTRQHRSRTSARFAPYVRALQGAIACCYPTRPARMPVDDLLGESI